jgi:hypothetical protein
MMILEVSMTAKTRRLSQAGIDQLIIKIASDSALRRKAASDPRKVIKASFALSEAQAAFLAGIPASQWKHLASEVRQLSPVHKIFIHLGALIANPSPSGVVMRGPGLRVRCSKTTVTTTNTWTDAGGTSHFDSTTTETTSCDYELVWL